MLEILQFEFMRNALLAGLLASIICGVIGTFVVINRLAFISGGIAHTAYGGIGLSFYFGLPYLLGTLSFSMLCAMILGAVTLKAKHRSDTIVAVLWAVGMALGVILIDLTPGYNVNLMSYLFGSILTVPMSDIWMMLALNIIIPGTVIFFFNDLIALSYDFEFAKVRGLPVNFLYFLLLGMITLCVVMVIQVVGLILVIAFLTISPYIAEKYAKSVSKMIIISVFLNFAFTSLGLWLSYLFNLSSGPTIIMVAGLCFFISLKVP
ncbi:Uncharacterized membrane protein slr2045 [Candidatus Magnetomoraceae bacterium gMMP-15]